jgi:hypothetical protein
MKNFPKIILFLLISVSLSGCKINFEGDVYTSDIIDAFDENSTIFIPMQISFQVSSCDEDLNDLHNELTNYFSEYQYMSCNQGSDFMSYATSKVKVPIAPSQESFDSSYNLVGYLVQEFDDGKYVFMTLNKTLFNSLNNYVEAETFQKLSLEESKVAIKIYNDMDFVHLTVFPSFVDGIPIIYETEYELEKRETLNILSSEVGAAHLEYNGWTPIFKFIDTHDL